jgi:hypothetical protein
MKLLLLTFGLSVTLVAGQARAVLVAADSFLTGTNRPAGQYGTGDIRSSGTTVLGWPALSQYTGSTSNFLIETAFQNSPAVTYDTEGPQGQVSWNGGTTVFNRNAVRALSPTTTSSTWWFSIMVNRLNWTTTQNSFAVAGFTTDSSGSDGLQIGYSDATSDGIPSLVLRSDNTLTTILDNAPSSTVQFVIAKLTLSTAGTDSISIWRNPADVSSEAALGATSIPVLNQEISNLLNPFTHSRFESPGVSGFVKFDEIRLATDFESLVAIPEASSFLAVGAVGMLFAAVRRFRRS